MVIFTIGLLHSCKDADHPNQTKEATIPIVQLDNILTSSEHTEGWTLLFDGTSIDQWHKYNTDSLNKNWVIDDGAIYFNPDLKDGGDLTSND